MYVAMPIEIKPLVIYIGSSNLSSLVQYEATLGPQTLEYRCRLWYCFLCFTDITLF